MKLEPVEFNGNETKLIKHMLVSDELRWLCEAVEHKRFKHLSDAAEHKDAEKEFPNQAVDSEEAFATARRYSVFLSVLKELQTTAAKQLFVRYKIQP